MQAYFELKDITARSCEFVDAFQGKLEELIKTEGLYPGVGIAVIANLNFHNQDIPSILFNRLDFSKHFENPEDPVVLGEIMKRINIKDNKINIDRTIRENVGEFILQYNFIRGFRPKREARKTEMPLDLPFNKDKFNYADERECDPEVFDSQKYSDTLSVDFLFNRYPFAPYHFLWVPNRKTGKHNQFIDPEKDSEILEAAWNLVTQEGYGKGLWVCYNSNGAHASVNHFHLQGFFLTKDWQPPIEQVFEEHDGSSSLKHYLKNAKWISLSDGVNGLKENIKEVNERYKKGEKMAYHFCMTPEGTAFFPRKHQGDDNYFALLQKANFTTGLAFFEMLFEIISPTAEISLFKKEETYKNILALYYAASLD